MKQESTEPPTDTSSAGWKECQYTLESRSNDSEVVKLNSIQDLVDLQKRTVGVWNQSG
jgi:hypothetical protein